MLLDELFDNSIPEPNTGCWLWMRGCNSAGYGVYQQQLAHRLSYMCANSCEIDSSTDVCHRCDNTYCVNPDYLFEGTRADNMQDASKKGRLRFGKSNHMTKFDDATVEAIIEQAKAGVPQWLIAHRFGTSQPHVSNLLNGNRRKQRAN